MSNILSMFDTAGAAEQGADLHLLHPATKEPVYVDGDKQKKPLIIKLKGTDSYEFEREMARRARMNKGKKGDADLEQAKREAAETYAKLTIGWLNMPDENGKELEFSFENAVKVYMNFKDIRVQVSEFITDKANFIKG